MQSSLFTSVLLPLALAMVMLALGLGLVPADFRRVTRQPKAVAVGLVCQVVFLPLLAGLVVRLIPMQPAIAVGLIILAACPGGPSSNLITYLARGDVALSVTLTAMSSLITVFTIPVIANFALQQFMGQQSAIALPIGSTMLQIFLITILPIAIGMTLQQRFPTTARRLERQTGRLAAGLLVLIVLLLLIREGSKLPGFIVQVGLGALVLNLGATLMGLGASTLFRLPLRQGLCIAIEVGLQNGTLAIALTAGLLNNPDMAIPAAVYSLLMNLTGGAAILYGRATLPAPSLGAIAAPTPDEVEV